MRVPWRLCAVLTGMSSAALQGFTVMPADAQLNVTAVAPGVTRVWIKPSGAAYHRSPSLAVGPAAAQRSPAGRVPAWFDAARITLQADHSWTVQLPLDADEHLYGLGQDNHNGGRLDRRGTVRDLWAGQQIQSGNVTAQYPVPLLLSAGGHDGAHGLFLDNVHRQVFDLAASRPDRVEIACAGGEIDLYLFEGPKLAEVIDRYTAVTGRPSLPPLWALGYWQSKCTFWDWDDLDRAYQHLAADGFPVDVMVIDADWPEVVTDYRWAKRWITSGHGLTPEQKIAAYRRKGVRIVMSQSGPMVRSDSPTFIPGWNSGVFATDGRGHPVQCGYYDGKLLDFTHPRLNDWLWPQTRRLDEAGIAGWWLDLDEPENEPVDTHYFGGLPAEIHNQFALLCALSFEGVQRAAHPDVRPFVLSRAASAGFQRHHGAVWSGDVASDYPTFRAHPPEMLNTGLSGLPWWACDTGGFLSGYYRNDRYGAHARLYERWMQFSAFAPLTRAHKAGGEPEPYAFGPETEASCLHYLKLRYRLLPYLYSYAWEATQNGLPPVRALPLEYSDAGSLAAKGDEFLFGRELLVAPVLEEGATQRRVYFPPGEWTDWDTGERYAGGASHAVDAPLSRIPVAVRAGAIIPLGPEVANTAKETWDPLTVEVFPRATSNFTLYRDDGSSFAYGQGNFTLTRFHCEETAGSVTLSIAPSNGGFVSHHYNLRFHLERMPIAVAVDGAASPLAWDARTHILSVSCTATDASNHMFNVKLNDSALPRIALTQ